jgi:uncharacterized protein involved in exopolysaccharide biosynthesis
LSDRLALAHAIEDAGIERAKAERVASVIVAAIYDHAATKVDVQAAETAVRADVAQLFATVQASEAGIRSELRASEAAIRGEIATFRAAIAGEIARLDTRIERLDAKVARIGSRTFNRLGALTVVVAGALFGALHYWPPH